MIAKEYNISFSEDIINEIREEMKPVDKNRFMSLLIKKRLDKCNELYLSDFDNELNEFMDMLDNGDYDVYQLMRVLNRASTLTNSLYKSQLSLYKVL